MAKKWYNEAYYDTYTDREWKAGTNNDDEPFAYCVPRNIWGYYTDMVPGNTEHWGKPYDESIALWKLNTASLIATNASVEIEQSSIITPHYYYTENSEPVPLIMAGINEGYSSTAKLYGYPSYRIADDYSYSQGNERSFLCFDVSYKNIVLCPELTVIDPSDGSETEYTDLDDILEAFEDISQDLDTIGCVLEYQIFRGPKIPRTGTSTEWSPPEGGEASWESWVMLDNYSYRPIPDDPNIKIRVQDEPGLGPHYDWRDDAIFSPFLSVLSDPWYKYEYTVTPPYLSALGYNVDFTCYEIINGYAQIDYSYYRATGFWARMNTAVKTFSDVSYHWENAIYDVTNHQYIQSGHDISNYDSDDKIKFVSKLVIDSKDSELSGPEALVHAILHELAYIGFYIAENPTTAANKITGSETDGIGLFLPIFDGDAPTGAYVTGEDIKDQPNADAESAGDVIPPDPDVYDASSPKRISMSIDINSVHMYNSVNMTALINNITAIPAFDGHSDRYVDTLFFGADPYDYILGYYLVPKMFIPQSFITAWSNTLETIKIGKYTANSAFGASEVQGYAMTLHVPLVREKFIEPVKIPHYFNSFLDYEPYTTMSLFLPYVGTIDIPPSIFSGHYISVDTSLDLLSGMVTYMIYADDIQFTTVSGNVRFDIPIHAADISAYSELMLRATYEKEMSMLNMIGNIGNTLGRAGSSLGISVLKGNAISAGTSLAGGSLSSYAAIASSVETMRLQETMLKRSSPSPLTISMGSFPDGVGNFMEPHLMINRPRVVSGFKTETYSKVNGYACYKNCKIGDVEGFTVIENPILDDLAISAKEKEMLRKLLSSGVILPAKETSS